MLFGEFVKRDWRSYDPVAESYARVAEGQYFARPARDLVSALDLAPGSRVLDVGTGTGAVAALAAEMIGPAGLVVGLDPAIGMLRGLKKRCGAQAVVGELPSLPHPDASFDAVAAAFVLTHVTDYAGALNAMVKTLRPNGRLAVSSWAQGESSTPPGETWKAVVREFVRDEDLRAALKKALPWDEKFSDPASLKTALVAAGLVRILVHEFKYSIGMTTQSFAESRLIGLSARFVKSVLPASEWVRLTEEGSRRLAATFGSRVRFGVSVNIAVGYKAG